MRVAAGMVLDFHEVAALQKAPSLESAIAHVVKIATGLLLLAGLRTPIAGVLLAIIEIWNSFTHPDDLRSCILLGTMGAALAMLGPGAWSVDARLFGWKRIAPPERKI
jgi:putative oxidoreductase